MSVFWNRHLITIEWNEGDVQHITARGSLVDTDLNNVLKKFYKDTKYDYAIHEEYERADEYEKAIAAYEEQGCVVKRKVK